jgi:hypothetical protein
MKNEIDETIKGLALLNKVSEEEMRAQIEAYRKSPDDDIEDLTGLYMEEFRKTHPEEMQKLISDLIDEMRNDYSIVQNDKGEITLIIHSLYDEPQNPRLVYDGSDTALLFINLFSTLLIKNINAETIEALDKTEELSVVEVLCGKTERQYKAELRKVKDVKPLYIG